MTRFQRGGLALLVALVVLADTWIAHALEYLRVGGAPGLGSALGGSVHGYMVWGAVIVAAGSGVAAGWLRRTWTGLGRRLDALVEAAGGAGRGQRSAVTAEAGPPVSTPTLGARLCALWLPLTGVQLALYVVQENLEAIRAGAPAPGAGVLIGVHAAAPVIHLYVALAGAVLLLAAGRALRGRAAAVVRAARRVAALLWTLGPPRPPARPAPADARPAVERWCGGPLRRRPPPPLTRPA